MGRDIIYKEYSSIDYKEFNKCIHDQVDLLKDIIQSPEFGKEDICIGAELELYLIDKKGDISPVNLQLLEMLKNNQYQSEMNAFNLELNLSPVLANGKPFSKLTKDMRSKFNYLWNVAEKINTRPLAIGILPTLKEQHLENRYMTDLGRYKILCKQLLEKRGESFHINIKGKEEFVDFYTPEACAEGANTSFQVHLMTDKNKFARIYNAAQMTVPMAVAISANSSVFLGKCLWHETRVVLFKQSIDNRPPYKGGWRQPARVTFGHGWVREGAWELFSETVNLYEPLIPQVFNENANYVENESIPKLSELSLHMGTTWPWHRPIFSNIGKGHLRIEFRALPAGPTALDMSANAAFSIGMAIGLADRIDEYMSRFPFQFAEYNFYRAAEFGLDASILWPQNYQNKPVEVPIINILRDMLQVADDGLTLLGVDLDERKKYLNIIQHRIETRITGALWIQKTLIFLRKSLSNEKACSKLLDMYFNNQMEGNPVSNWECDWK